MFPAFTRYFTFKGPASAQVHGFSMQSPLKHICMCEIKYTTSLNLHLESFMSTSKSFAYVFLVQNTFKAGNRHQNITTWLFKGSVSQKLRPILLYIV